MADPFTSSPAARSADDLSELRSRLAALEQKERDSDRQRRRRRITAATCALGVALTAGTVAMAAPGDCHNGMPFCFAPDSPASAAQVNENFAHVRGLNAAWASRGTSINLNTGPRSVVTSVTVPAGSYVVSGKLYGFAPAGANLLCSLTDPAGTGFDTTNSHPSNNYASVSLLGTVTLATGGSISIQCQTQGSVAYTLYSVALVVTPVSALN